jgi:hypothetical protein
MILFGDHLTHPHPSEAPVSKTEFFLSFEADLRLRHVPFDKAELAKFLGSVWPLVEADDPPAKWAEAFLVGTVAAG